MINKTHLALSIVVLGASSMIGLAQQNLPRPIVLYRSPSAAPQSPGPAARTTTAPAAQRTQTGTRPVPVVIGANAPAAGQPGKANSTNPASNPNSPADPKSEGQSDQTQKTPEQEWAEQQTRPTNQMLLNPSGAYGLTHTGFTAQQQMAPNTYLGPQFQTWSGQQSVPQMPASFGEMNRFQPGGFGGYVGPNTFVGSDFANWSNLSQGMAMPGSTGSWGFSVWP
jgi:hypothetical protein